jgi:hypothetical protein
MEVKVDMPLLTHKKKSDKIPFRLTLQVNDDSLTLFVECMDPTIDTYITGPTERGMQLAYRIEYASLTTT